MTDIALFRPASHHLPMTLEQWRETLARMRPDMTAEQLDAAIALFGAMRERVNWPCRRVGADVRRAGPVLFDPCQHARRQLAE